MPDDAGARLNIQVQPGASRNMITRYADGVLHVKIAAPPVRGKANQELVKFLSKVLGVSKSSVIIEKGTTSRRKVVLVEGMKQADAEAILGKQGKMV
ncbi:MAG TPA: YggU family protein [Dehalococcoidia bacterium]|nr:YggU family protein [Dehalococcoidia bacterium]